MYHNSEDVTHESRQFSRRKVAAAGGVGILSILSGCNLLGADQSGPEPVQVRIDNNYTESRTITVTVTNSEGETVFEESATADAGEDVILGDFVPESADSEQTYTVTAEPEDGSPSSLEFPAGGASGTHSIFITIMEDGELKLSRAQE